MFRIALLITLTVASLTAEAGDKKKRTALTSDIEARIAANERRIDAIGRELAEIRRELQRPCQTHCMPTYHRHVTPWRYEWDYRYGWVLTQYEYVHRNNGDFAPWWSGQIPR